MGFSVSGSAAILFIAAFVSVGILYSAAYNGYERVQDAENSYDDRILDQRNTDVNITNATYNASGNERVTVHVKNKGSTTLSVNETDLLIDGVFEPRSEYVNWNIDGETDTTLWLPGETYNITVNAGQPERVKIVTAPGVSETATVEGT